MFINPVVLKTKKENLFFTVDGKWKKTKKGYIFSACYQVGISTEIENDSEIQVEIEESELPKNWYNNNHQRKEPYVAQTNRPCWQTNPLVDDKQKWGESLITPIERLPSYIKVETYANGVNINEATEKIYKKDGTSDPCVKKVSFTVSISKQQLKFSEPQVN